MQAAAGIETGAGGVIRFHRVLAPADRMKDWPLGDGRYLPMDAAEFQRLVEAANSRRSRARSAPPAAVAAARYEANWLANGWSARRPWT